MAVSLALLRRLAELRDARAGRAARLDRELAELAAAHEARFGRAATVALILDLLEPLTDPANRRAWRMEPTPPPELWDDLDALRAELATLGSPDP